MQLLYCYTRSVYFIDKDDNRTAHASPEEPYRSEIADHQVIIKWLNTIFANLHITHEKRTSSQFVIEYVHRTGATLDIVYRYEIKSAELDETAADLLLSTVSIEYRPYKNSEKLYTMIFPSQGTAEKTTQFGLAILQKDYPNLHVISITREYTGKEKSQEEHQ